MMKKNYHFNPMGLMIFLLIVLLNCQSRSSENEMIYLIKVRDSVVTVSDFKHAFEELGGNIPSDDNDLNQKMKLRLVNQFIDELVIKERAKDIDIDISNGELKKAVESIKKDYPDDTFDQILLENAISFTKWKEGLKTRLLIEKVISKELKDQIEITPEDIASFYESRYQSSKDVDTQSDTDINQKIINQLRREKSEETYQRWMKALKEQYRVEINKAQWKRLLGE